MTDLESQELLNIRVGILQLLNEVEEIKEIIKRECVDRKDDGR